MTPSLSLRTWLFIRFALLVALAVVAIAGRTGSAPRPTREPDAERTIQGPDGE